MPKTAIAIAVFLGALNVSLAQQPPGPAPATPPAAPAAAPLDPSRNELDGHLMRWEEAMKKVNSLALSCNRTEVDPVYKSKKTFTGTIHFLKPAYFFWHMQIKDRPEEWERFVGTGTYIYQFVPAQKEVKVYPAPKTTGDGRLADDSSIAFLFGMKAAEAKGRYDLKLHKVDANYVYVDVIPKNAVDKADFTKARLVLNKSSYLPRQIWFEHPNAGEVLWDLPAVQANVELKPITFATPQTPKDWKVVNGQAASPRLVRPQDR